MLSEDSIVAIVTAIIMSGALSSLIGWLTQHLSRRHEVVTKGELAEQLESALAKSPTIKEIDGKLSRDYANLHEFRLTQLRQCLFAHPFDQNSHENAIQSGREYSRIGGNGVGHIRLSQLEANYARRVHDDDWDYTHDRP